MNKIIDRNFTIVLDMNSLTMLSINCVGRLIFSKLLSNKHLFPAKRNMKARQGRQKHLWNRNKQLVCFITL